VHHSNARVDQPTHLAGLQRNKLRRQAHKTAAGAAAAGHGFDNSRYMLDALLADEWSSASCYCCQDTAPALLQQLAEQRPCWLCSVLLLLLLLLVQAHLAVLPDLASLALHQLHHLQVVHAHSLLQATRSSSTGKATITMNAQKEE
jgi:hypothetical protein